MNHRSIVASAAWAALLFAGCAPPSELELRFEAERLRWRIDREEERVRRRARNPGPEVIERIRELHDEVHRRFGASAVPSTELLRDPDAFRRLRIAAASSLYRADLAAEYAPSADAVDEFARIAEVYAFDREVALRALFGKGRLLEKLGRPGEALEANALLFERYPAVPVREGTWAVVPQVNDLLLDLEIHSLVLAEAAGTEASEQVAKIVVNRLEQRAKEWRATRLERVFTERLAQARIVRGEWAEAIAVLEHLRTLESGSGRAETALKIADVSARGLHDLGRAASELERAASEGKGSEVEAKALLRLAEIELERGRPADALARVHVLTDLRARHLDSRRTEALFLQAKAFAAQGRWEDAIPAFARVGELDRESPWGILAQQEVVLHWRATGRTGAAREAERAMIAVARRVRDVDPENDTPFGWEGFWSAPREEALWSQCVAALLASSRDLPDSTEAASAREEADRIERTRLRFSLEQSGERRIKAGARNAEGSTNGETP